MDKKRLVDLIEIMSAHHRNFTNSGDRESVADAEFFRIATVFLHAIRDEWMTAEGGISHEMQDAPHVVAAEYMATGDKESFRDHFFDACRAWLDRGHVIGVPGFAARNPGKPWTHANFDNAMAIWNQLESVI